MLKTYARLTKKSTNIIIIFLFLFAKQTAAPLFECAASFRYSKLRARFYANSQESVLRD